MNISNGTNSTLITGSQYADKILNRGTKVTLKSNNGNDDVENYGENSKIYLSYGDDYARNYAAKVTIDGNAGNDRIVNTGNDSSISAGAGYDSVENYGDYSTINISVGNNYILNEGAGTKINGGIGDDSIDNKGDKTIIKSGGGSDIISSNAEYVSIDSGANNNTILNYGDYASIKTGNGNNYTFNHGNKVTIQGGKGYNGVFNYGEYVLVSMTGGTNYIYDYNDRNTIIGGAGNDTIFSNGHTGLYKTGGGSDSITATGDFLTVDGGAGNDRISVNTDYSSIEGGAGVDTINAIGDRNYISGGAGNDIITSNGDKVTLETGKGDDMVFAAGENLQILLDGDNNALFLEATKNSTIITGTGSDYISADESSALFIEAGTGGDDEISGFAANDTIKMASAVKNSYIDGNDFVIEFAKGSFRIQDFGYSSIQAVNTSGELVTLNAQPEGLTLDNKTKEISVTGGEGADTITNSGANVTIDSGNGNDSVTNSGANSKINVGVGNHTINNSGANTVIEGGEGKLSITNSGNGVTINSGNSKNTITNTADSVLINGGKEYANISTSGKNVTIKSNGATSFIEINGKNTGTVLEYSADDGGILVVSGMGSNDTLDLKGASYLTFESGSLYSVIVGDKTLNFTTNDFKINGVKSNANTYTIKNGESLTVDKIIYTATDGNAVLNLGENGKITGIASGKVMVNVDAIKVLINATKGGEKFTAEADGDELIITKNVPITFSNGSFTYNGESLTAEEGATFTQVVECDGYSSSNFISCRVKSVYKITDTEMIIDSKNTAIMSNLTDEENSNLVIADLSGKITYNYSDNSFTPSKGATEIFYIGGYVLTTTAIDSAGSNISMDMNGLNFNSGNGAVNFALSSFNQNEIISGDLKCTEGKIIIGYDDTINFADNTNFEFNKYGYTLTASTIENSKVALELNETEFSLKPVEDEGSLHLTLKNGKNKIFDNTLTISDGAVIISTTDVIDRKKFSLTQDTTIKIENDNQIITATAQADINAYFWRDAKGIFYFKIDGDAANFALNISQPDGTEIFNGEFTFGGCITYNDKKPNFALISDLGSEGYESFVQFKDTAKTIYAQTPGKNIVFDAEMKGGKLTANFTKKDNNSVNLTITKDETEILNDIIDIEGSLTFDTEQRKLLINKGAKVTSLAGYSIKNSVLTLDKYFSDSELNLTNYEFEVTKIDTTKFTSDISVIGNSLANSIKGGKSNDTFSGAEGNDTIIGGKGDDEIDGGADNDILKGEAGNDSIYGGGGNDTLYGGAGADVFVYSEGNDIIEDYKTGEDIISATYTSSSVKGSDVILTTANGTLTVKNVKDKAITFINDEGETSDLIFFADLSYTPLEKGLSYDSKRTVLTVSNEFEDYGINLENYLPTVIKVNAGAFKDSIIITGNDLNNSIKGGKGNDTLTGGAGSDIFVYESGDDVITDYTAGQDSIVANEEVKNVEYDGKNVILTMDSGTLTVKNAKGKEILVTNGLDDGEKIYSRTLEILYDNNFAVDDFNLDSIPEKNYSVGEIEYLDINEKFTIGDSVVADSSFTEK